MVQQPEIRVPASATEFADMSPAGLRLSEAKYLLERFKHAGRVDHNGTLFLMTTYFDAFLFSLVSIEEMITGTKRSDIKALPLFRLFKALRNVTTHHCVLTGIHDSKFPRPIVRILSVGVGCRVVDKAKFRIDPNRLNSIFDEILKERPWEKKTIEAARSILGEMSQTRTDIVVTELMSEAIDAIEPIVTNDEPMRSTQRANS